MSSTTTPGIYSCVSYIPHKSDGVEPDFYAPDRSVAEKMGKGKKRSDDGMEERKASNEQLISYDEAVKIGVREGIKYIKEQEYYKTKKRYDRRLRNTRLLLKNYRGLIAHTRMANSSANKIKKENAIDVLDNIDSIDDEEQYIQAISRTKIRTLIILQHIDKVLNYYRLICNSEGGNKKRKYEILEILFISKIDNNIMPTYEDVAEQLEINKKTVSRDVQESIQDLSLLLFGIDGIKL